MAKFIKMLISFITELIRGYHSPEDTPADPPAEDEADFVCRRGVFTEDIYNKTSGTVEFWARGFDSEKYEEEGSGSNLKPVFCWMRSGEYSYGGNDLLFELRQYLYKGYYCAGGKIKARNRGKWVGEKCYQLQWDKTRWYHFTLTWGHGDITLVLENGTKYSLHVGKIKNELRIGYGWPPERRDGIEGLEYRFSPPGGK